MKLDEAERRVRTLIAVGMTACFVGLAVAATFDPLTGGAIGVLGWFVLAYSVHKLGRFGSA